MHARVPRQPHAAVIPADRPSTRWILKVVTWAYTSINVLDSAKAFCLFDILIVGVSLIEVKVKQENVLIITSLSCLSMAMD